MIWNEENEIRRVSDEVSTTFDGIVRQLDSVSEAARRDILALRAKALLVIVSPARKDKDKSTLLEK